MDKYCMYCGSPLQNGECTCSAFKNSQKNLERKPPFFITKYHLNFKSFSSFISSVRDQSGMNYVDAPKADPYEHNVPIVPNCIPEEDNEIVVKQYNIAKLRSRLKFMNAEGRLQVTNRRVLFRASGKSLAGNTLQEHQFNLDELGGVEIHKDHKFSILSFLLSILIVVLASFFVSPILAQKGGVVLSVVGILLGVLGTAPTFIVFRHFGLKMFAACIACIGLSTAYDVSNNVLVFILMILAILIFLVNLIIFCYVPNLVIKIKTKGASGAIVIGSQKTMFRRKSGDDYSGFKEVLPWEDTEAAMNELGTMIDDLQKLGDYAIEKWREQ